MKIAISNLGPVREADIELKPVTIFVGLNNLGKSFIATVLHAALSRSLIDSATRGWYYKRALESKEEEEGLGSLVHKAFGARKISSYNDVAEPLREFFRKRLRDALEVYDKGLVVELQRTTGASIRELRRVQKSVR